MADNYLFKCTELVSKLDAYTEICFKLDETEKQKEYWKEANAKLEWPNKEAEKSRYCQIFYANSLSTF